MEGWTPLIKKKENLVKLKFYMDQLQQKPVFFHCYHYSTSWDYLYAVGYNGGVWTCFCRWPWHLECCWMLDRGRTLIGQCHVVSGQTFGTFLVCSVLLLRPCKLYGTEQVINSVEPQSTLFLQVKFSDLTYRWVVRYLTIIFWYLGRLSYLKEMPVLGNGARQLTTRVIVAYFSSKSCLLLGSVPL